MPNTFDSIPQALTQRALANNFSLEEKSRREAMTINKDFYYGKQEGRLTLMNEDVDPLILNLTKPVIKKRSSLLYKKPLVREFEGPSQSATLLELVYKENRVDSFLGQVDLASELTGTALVYPELVTPTEERTSGIRLRLFDGTAISVVPQDEDQSEAAAVSLINLIDRLAKTSTEKNPQVERIIRQQIWTEGSVTTYDGQLLVSTESNNLGFLPFVNFKGEEVYDQYLGHAPGTIIRLLNEDINQLLTHLSYLIKMQAGTPIALAGYQSGEGVVIHPGRAFSVPAGANVFTLDTNPQLAEVLEVIQYLEEKMFETSSVPKITVVGGEGVSGRELLVRWFPLLQVFQEKAVRFERYELELANMILKVAGLPLLEEVNVDYPEADLLPLSSEEETIEQDIRLNIKTPIDEIMRRNPEMSEEEAEAEMLANKEVNDMMRPAAVDEEGNPIDPEEEPEEGEEEEPDEDGDKDKKPSKSKEDPDPPKGKK